MQDYFLADFFLPDTASLKPDPALNFGTVVAAILIVAPVLGFLPVRAARLADLKVPKPTRVTVSPLETALTTAAMMLSRTLPSF